MAQEEDVPEVVGEHYYRCPALDEDWYHWTCPSCLCPYNTASELDDGRVVQCDHDPLPEYPGMVCGQKVKFKVP